MASSKESFNIEKLNQNNNVVCKFKAEILLIKHDLYDYITDDPHDSVTND